MVGALNRLGPWLPLHGLWAGTWVVSFLPRLWAFIGWLCQLCHLVVIGLFWAVAHYPVFWLYPLVACARVVGRLFYFACPGLWVSRVLVAFKG